VGNTILEGRLQILDFREGTLIRLMIMISPDHDHHDHLRSAFQSSAIANLQLNHLNINLRSPFAFLHFPWPTFDPWGSMKYDGYWPA
jgi:hypothetical protein